MSNPRTITLAGRTYEVRPLTLGFVEDISVANAILLEDATTPSERTRLTLRARREVVAAGISTPEQPVTPDDLKGMAITFQELTEANDRVLEFAGLITKKAAKDGDKPGEAQAETAA